MTDDPQSSPQANGPIRVVYGVYLHPASDWRAIMAGQIGDLRACGLLDAASLHVIVTDLHGTPGLEAFLTELCPPGTTFRIHRENRYEFWALHHLWSLARENPEGEVAYFHSKSISRGIQRRSKTERTLTRETFRPWRDVLPLLRRGGIAKAGLFPAEEGWVWFNFWWARADYIARLPEPEPSTNRYTFEAWLSGKLSADGVVPRNDAFSLHAWSSRRYGPEEAGRQMRRLANRRLLRWRGLRRLFLRLRGEG
ncbi:hypothetical protein IAI18_13260 [Acetobacteraceae bacterium H6797]|nr:hypothetical protein [Acetobacteraceae bacterium H6797]